MAPVKKYLERVFFSNFKKFFLQRSVKLELSHIVSQPISTFYELFWLKKTYPADYKFTVI